MSNANSPFGRLTGTWSAYLAAPSTARPLPSVTPDASWALFGPTDGDQSITFAGPLVKFYDNDHQGPVKSWRPQEDPMVSFTIVNLTLENLARILSSVGVVTDQGGYKRMPLRRGPNPTRYALLLRKTTGSPYGEYPEQIYIPIAVNGSEPQEVRARGGSPGYLCNFHAEEDDTQPEGESLGVREAGEA